MKKNSRVALSEASKLLLSTECKSLLNVLKNDISTLSKLIEERYNIKYCASDLKHAEKNY